MAYALVGIGLVLLIKGGDWLVSGASSLARRFGVSEMIVGLTVVAFGTSAPELIVNLVSAFSGNTAIAIGNIFGSNIVNVFFVLGLSAMIFPLAVSRETVWKQVPLSFLAAFVLAVMASDAYFDPTVHGVLSRGDGIILLSFFAIFAAYMFSYASASKEETEIDTTEVVYGNTRSIALILGGLVLLVLGGRAVVSGAVEIASSWGVSQLVIALTVVAIGTSLPELFTSVIAAFKAKPDIAVGNVIGSNIFNVFFILGITAVVRPLPFAGVGPLDIIMLLTSSAIVFIWMFVGRKNILDRWQGATLVLLYLFYLASLMR